MKAPSEEITVAAARLVVEEGLEYAAAKHRAARVLARHGGRGAGRQAVLPGNAEIETAVREHIALFCAESQPAELAALRRVARQWMVRLAEFRPHLSGAVWRGTATRLSSVHLDLYCDDGKAAEIAIVNTGVDCELAPGSSPEQTVLSLSSPSPELGEPVTLHLHLHDHDDLRGALKSDAEGRTWRGDLAALDRLLTNVEARP